MLFLPIYYIHNIAIHINRINRTERFNTILSMDAGLGPGGSHGSHGMRCLRCLHRQG